MSTATTVDISAIATETSSNRLEVAFIDTNVTDYQSLIDGITAGVEVVLLDANQDGVLQMAEWAQTHSGYDAIHILSHGSAGSVQLGNSTLNNANLSTYNEALAQIGAALTESGDILVYGCNVAEGETGSTFIGNLAQVTSADIAASTDITGSPSQNADWELESNTGTINTDSVISTQVQENYKNTLATENYTFDFSNGTTSTTNLYYDIIASASSDSTVKVKLYFSSLSMPSYDIIIDDSYTPGNSYADVSTQALIGSPATLLIAADINNDGTYGGNGDNFTLNSFSYVSNNSFSVKTSGAYATTAPASSISTTFTANSFYAGLSYFSITPGFSLGPATIFIDNLSISAEISAPTISDLNGDTTSFVIQSTDAPAYIDNQFNSLPVSVTDSNTIGFDGGSLLIHKTSGGNGAQFLSDPLDGVLYFGTSSSDDSDANG